MFDLLCFVVVNSVYVLGVVLDGSLEVRDPAKFLTNFLVLGTLIFTFRIATGFYKNVWRYVYTKAYLSAILIDTCSALVGAILTSVVRQQVRIWYFVIVSALFTLLTLTSRYVYRALYKYQNKLTDEPYSHKINVAIVGAGQIGALLADELRYSKTSSYNPIAFIDKDASKEGGLISGIKVYKEDEEIVDIIKKLPVQEIFIAIPQLDGDRAKMLYDYYNQDSYRVKLYDFSRHAESNPVASSKLVRDFKIEDLLFRNAINVADEATASFYRGKVVLVTGGGGSIGSELCRQISKFNPKNNACAGAQSVPNKNPCKAQNNIYKTWRYAMKKYPHLTDVSIFTKLSPTTIWAKTM